MYKKACRVRSVPSIRRSIAVSAILGLAAIGVAGPAGPPARAADPSPSPASAEPGIEVWIDEALPPDVPVGRSVEIGATLWDAARAQLSRVGADYVRVHPKTGKAPPSEAAAHSDWPGHVTAMVVIPKGGLGEIELGVRGSQCLANGSCGPIETPFKTAGTGPPPDAPRSVLVDTTWQFSEDAVAGKPMELGIDLVPKAAWGLDSLALPDRLVVVAATPDKPDLAQAELKATSAADGSYRGSITIPEGGDVVLTIAFPGNGTEDDVIARTRLSVKGDGPSGAATPGAVAPPGAATTDSGSQWPLVVGLIVVVGIVVAGGFVLRRVLSDL